MDKSESYTENIKADIIILGCSLPGIVTAYKLKTKFGDSMDIVILDLGRSKLKTKCHVAFQEENEDVDSNLINNEIVDRVTRHYLYRYTKEFKIPLARAVISSGNTQSSFQKLFQYRNGRAVQCESDYNDYSYLNSIEKFELSQYHSLLDQCIINLFATNKQDTEADCIVLRSYDQTLMEQHICDCLLFPTSRDIMRTTVRLICGAPSNSVSVLFYLHQCYRTSGSRNHIGGDNARLKEKLINFCRKRISHKLQQSIADITRPAMNIKEIRCYSEQEVILEMIGDNNYVCNLLAMALRPDQLLNIHFERQLVSESELAIARSMKQGHAKKFLVQYEENFWRKNGYSGDILSARGPILWAMERPELSATGSIEKYATLIGFLKVGENEEFDLKTAVLDQLVKLFGAEAASPVEYSEGNIADIFIPKCGDYVALRKWTRQESPTKLEWGALDVFGEGDLAAALEAGHMAYVRLLSCLRPQAQSYDDIRKAGAPVVLVDDPLKKWMACVNYIRALRVVAYTSALYIGIRLIHSFVRRVI